MTEINCERCEYKNECEKEYGKERQDGDDYRAICGTHFCKLSWKPFYQLREKNIKMDNIGKWVVVIGWTSPIGVGKIVGDYIKYWDVELPWGIEPKNKKSCIIYDTELEAQKAYHDYMNDKNNFAYEG